MARALVPDHLFLYLSDRVWMFPRVFFLPPRNEMWIVSCDFVWRYTNASISYGPVATGRRDASEK